MASIEGLKAAAGVLRAADKIPEYQQILEAMQQLLELQSELHTALSRNRELEAIIAVMKDDTERVKGAVRQCDLYMLDGHRYCPRCLDLDKRLVPVVKILKYQAKGTAPGLQCTHCKQEFDPYRNP